MNAGRLLSAVPNVGMSRRTANRIAVEAGYRDVEDFLLAHGKRGGMPEPAGAGGQFRFRDSAARQRGVSGYSEAVIGRVISRYTDSADAGRPLKWWMNKFAADTAEQLNALEQLRRRRPQPGTEAGEEAPGLVERLH